MRKLFVLILVVIAVASLGLHRGWFHIGTESGTDSSKVTFTLDKEKVQQDKDKAMGNAQDLQHKVQEQTTGAIDKSNRPTTQTAARP